MSALPEPAIPLFLGVRLRLFPRWLVTCAWRSPVRALTLLAAIVTLGGFVVLAVNTPAGTCHWKIAGVSGGRAHLMCERRPAA